jgi:hypothetical protein
MSSLLRLAVLVLLVGAVVPACIVIDVRADHEGHGFQSDGLISGHATAGWPAEDSLLRLGLLGGDSKGSIFLLQVWKLFRVEVGLIGLSVGVGPLDIGAGVLFYGAEPPAYCDDTCADCGDADCDGDCNHDEHEEHDDG